MRFSDLVDDLRSDERAVGETVVHLLTIGATLLIGALVMSQIVSTVPAPNGGPFVAEYEQIVDILNRSFVLAAVLPVVIVAGAVLSHLRRFDRV